MSALVLAFRGSPKRRKRAEAVKQHGSAPDPCSPLGRKANRLARVASSAVVQIVDELLEDLLSDYASDADDRPGA